MNRKILPLASVAPISMFAEQTALADIAPPTDVVADSSLADLIPLGILAAIVVIVSILVIWAVKKSRTPKEKS